MLTHVLPEPEVSSERRHVATRAQWSCTMVTLVIGILLERAARTHQLLGHPLGALGQEFEIGVGVNIEDVYQLCLKQGSNIDPFLVDLLDSIKHVQCQKKYKKTKLVSNYGFFWLQDIFMVTRNQLTGVGVVRYCYYGHGCGRRNDGRCHGRGSCPVPRQDSETKPCSKEC